MARLSSFFQTEMARTAGSIAPTTRRALEMARQSGEEFSVEQFCRWLIEAGVPGPGPGDDPKAFMKRMSMSVNQRVKKMTADREAGERPSALKPLIATRVGRTGPGGGGLFRYVYDGPAGVPLKGLSKPQPEDEIDDIPDADDEGEGEFADAPEPPAPVKAKMPPHVLPKPSHGEGASYPEETMADLSEIGFGEDNEIWPQIANAENDVAVQKIMNREGVPPMARTKIIRIAKHIFNRMGKDWETGGAATPEPAAQGAGDRKYTKGFQGKSKSPIEYEVEPPTAPTAADDEEGEFISPDDDEEFIEPDPTTATQAGASNFVKPTAKPNSPATGPAPHPVRKSQATVGNVANWMKKFSKKR